MQEDAGIEQIGQREAAIGCPREAAIR
jgi:hypothetical protein